MVSRVRMSNPKRMPKPSGTYSHVARVSARELMFIAGQVSVDTRRGLVGAGDFEAQARQVFHNLLAALKSEGAGYANVVQFTTYLVNSRDIPKLRAFRERHYPKFFPDGKYPPNTLLVVDRLASEDMLLEISAIAALD